MMWVVQHLANRAGQNYPLLETQNQALYLRRRLVAFMQPMILESIWKRRWTTSRIILRVTLPAATGTSFLNLSMVPGNTTGDSIHHKSDIWDSCHRVIVVVCLDCHYPPWGPPHGALWRDLPRYGDLTSTMLHHLAMSRFIFAELLFSFVMLVLHAHLPELLQKSRGA